jgi:hypothetical protein
MEYNLNVFTEDSTGGQYDKEMLERMNKELSRRMSNVPYSKDHPIYEDLIQYHSDMIMHEDYNFE